MNLPIKLPSFLDKKPKNEYYLALLLRDEKVSAVIIEQAAGKVSIVGKHEEYFPESLEETSIESLVQVLDKTISQAESTLPPDIEVQNTVFGVKDTWVEEKKIKKDYLAKLKEVCAQLSLSPMGFIVLSEAIAHLIQKEEGAPISALLTEIGKQSVTISLFRAGKLIEAKHSPIEETPMKTADALLKTFERVEIFPSRVILYNAGLTGEEHHDALAQKFISHQWSKSLPFLHVPQISILPAGFDGKAIVFGAATQLGFELVGAGAKDIAIKTYEKHHPISTEKVVSTELEEAAQLAKAEVTTDVEEDIADKDETLHKEPVSHEHLKKVKADNFGFVVDEDITTVPTEALQSSAVEASVDDDEEEEPVVGTHHATQHHTPHHAVTDETDDDEQEEEDISPRPAGKKRSLAALLPLAALSGFTKRINMKALSMPKLPVRGGKMLIIPPLVLLLFIGLALLYIFKLQATVTLMVSPRMVDESQRIAFSTTSGNDFSANIIAAKDVSVTLEDTLSTPATGSKEVGEKAKGTVTIYNSGNSRRTLKEGATITSSNNLTYTLDKEVAIASASGDIFSGIKSGTAQVAVTAKNIGAEYNLPSNSKFSVEGSNDLAAKNDSAFSGGSKKKVTVVAKKDVDKLTQELPKKLEEKAAEEMKAKLGGNDVLIPGFTDTTFDEKNFDRDVDEEAKEVKLTGKVTFTAVTYQKDDVTQFSQAALKSRFAQDQTIPEKNITTNVESIKRTSDSEVTGVLEIKAGLLPKLDNAKIAKDITGKSFTQVQEHIKTLPQVTRADIMLSPNLPLLPKSLPRFSDNITVIIQPNE